MDRFTPVGNSDDRQLIARRRPEEMGGGLTMRYAT